MTDNLVKEQLAQLPDSPGVYLMKDIQSRILYVGKAASLKNRVRSYFAVGDKLTPKTRKMVSQVGDIEFYITASEQEALILESNLIKRHHPPYNIQLRDDKSFPYLKITVNEDWPRVYLTRHLVKDGGRYFGPFTSAWSLRQTIKVLRGIFPFRFCSRAIKGSDSRVCLEYHMGRCLAPCIGAVTREEYDQVIKQVILFLEGKQGTIIQELKKKMSQASKSLDYERAARLRDQIQAIESVAESQKIATVLRGEQDIVAFAQDKNEACVQVFLVRDNRLIGRESFVLQGTQYEEPQRIMSNFVKQFYSLSPYIPPLLLLQYPLEDRETIQEWLKSKRGGNVTINVPQRGKKKEQVDLVAENARQGLAQLMIKRLAAPRALDVALAEIQSVLGLRKSPHRIEAFDISDIQGKSAVGSMVVFENGKPKKSHYRRFKIRTVAGADDYAMLREVLQRRFKRSASNEASDWSIIPDLVLIDGGKGQLNAALSAIVGSGYLVPVASLAKENEEIFIPEKKKPVVLPASSPALQLLQRLRDEAHRFAIGYYQKTHKKEIFTSVLDGIVGIGPKRKRSLLKHFGSVQAIRDASVEELSAVIGISQAKKVKEHL